MTKRIISLMLTVVLLFSCMFVGAEEVNGVQTDSDQNASALITQIVESDGASAASEDGVAAEKEKTVTATASSDVALTQTETEQTTGSADEQILSTDTEQGQAEIAQETAAGEKKAAETTVEDASDQGEVQVPSEPEASNEQDGKDSGSEAGSAGNEADVDSGDDVTEETTQTPGALDETAPAEAAEGETASEGEEAVNEDTATEGEAGFDEEIDYSRNLSYSPAFHRGYVELREGTSLYTDHTEETAFATVKKGVAYAFKRANAGGRNDKVYIAYADADGEYTACVSASDATPLDAEAVEVFLSRLPDSNGHFYDKEKTVPLSELELRLIVSEEAGADEEASDPNENNAEDAALEAQNESETDTETAAIDESEKETEDTQAKAQSETGTDTAEEKTNEQTASPTTSEQTEADDSDVTRSDAGKESEGKLQEETKPETQTENENGTGGQLKNETDDKSETENETDEETVNDPQDEAQPSNDATEKGEDGAEEALKGQDETLPDDETDSEPVSVDGTVDAQTGELTETDAQMDEQTQTDAQTDEQFETEAPRMFMSMRALAAAPAQSVDIVFDDFGDKIGLGDKLTVSAYAVDESGTRTGEAVAFRVEGSCVELSEDTLSAKEIGSFVLTATTELGLSKSQNMRVTAEPTSISIGKDSVTVGMNGTAALTYRVNEGSAGSAVWTSSDESVAKVSKNGIVTGVSSGTAVVTVTSYNGLSDYCAVSVMSEPDDLKLSVSSITLSENETVQVDTAFTGDVFGNVYCEDISGDAQIELESLGGGAFSIKGVYSGHASALFYVYNKTTDQTYFARLDITVEPAVTRIEFKNPRSEIGLKEMVDLQPVAYDARGNVLNESITLSTSNKAYVSINGGAILGQRTGSATVTAKAGNGVSESLSVKTVKAPTSITLNAKTAELSVGEEIKLNHTLSAGSASAITWTSSDESVATVDSEGNVKAVGAGNAKITAATFVKNKFAVCDISVSAAPQAVSFDKNEYDVLEGMTLSTALVFTPSNAAGKVEYKIEDRLIASVDENGVVTGLNTGKTTVTVVAHSALTGEDFSASAVVNVNPAPASIVLGNERRAIGKGETIELAPKAYDKYGEPLSTAFTLTSSKPKIVAVSGDKAIKGVATGTADITITAENGYSAKITVKVLSAPTKLTLSPVSLSLAAGESAKLEYKLAPATTATEIIWTSDNEAVATVAEGVVTARAPGTAKIRCATYLSAVYAECSVTVYAAPTAIEFDADEITVYEGQEIAPAVTLLPSGASGEVVYELDFADEEAIAAVNENKLKGIYSGTATLTARVFNYEINEYVSDSVAVKVLPAVSSIAFRSDRSSIGLKETVDLKPVAYDARGNEIEANITISIAGGYVKAVEGTSVYGNAKGTSTITATAENGVKTSKKFSVVAAPSSVKISASETKVAVGESIRLKAITTGSDTADVTWSSSDENVLSVSQSGTVTAVSVGSASITAATYNGKTASIEISAVHAPDGISFSLASYSVSEGGSVQTALMMEPAESAAKPVYSISDSDGEFEIATVDANTGLVSGKTSGTATLIAVVTDHETGNTISASAEIVVTKAPADIEIAGRTTIGVGESIDLIPTAYDGRGNAIDTTFTLTSSAAGTVKVVGGTTVKGLKRGNATITVKAANGASATVKIVVDKAPTAVKLKETKLNLQRGDTFQLEHSFNDGQSGAVSYLSSDSSVVSVNENGLITALAVGSATVTVKSYNNKSAKLTVTVYASPTGISFTKSEIKLVLGAQEPLAAVLSPAGSWADISYTSSDESIATVDADGKLSAKKLGGAVITATAYSHEFEQQISAQLNVEVCRFPVEVVVPRQSYTIGVGEQITISPAAYNEQGDEINTEFTFETGDKRIATVNGSSVKGVKFGTVKVTVSAPGGSKSVITVQVMNAPGAIKLDKELSMAVGETFKLEPIFNAKQFGSVTWTTSDESIATVAADGSVKALRQGTAKITAKTYNNKTAVCTLKVFAAPTGLSFGNASYTVSEGETVATVLNLEPNGSFARPVYSISSDGDTEVATVDANGRVSGIYAGKATLTAVVYNAEMSQNISASCEIVVVPAAVTISIEQTRTKIGVGETIDLKPVAYDRSGNKVETSFTLKSSSVYQLSVSGTSVKGLRASTPTVTVTSANGTSMKVKLTVAAAPSKIALSASTTTIALNNSVKVSADVNNVPDSPLSWTSSDTGIATVNGAGTVTAVGLGEVTITAATYNNKKASIKLTVVPEADSISFAKSEAKVGLGGTQLIAAVLPQGAAANVIYASINPFIAKVNAQTGEVTGVRVGTTRIVATIKNKTTGSYYKAAYSVTVTPVPASIGFGTDRRTMGVNEKLALEAQAYDANGDITGSTFTYKSSNANVVSVDATGLMTAKRAGTATITVTSYNGIKQTVSMRVVTAPTAIKFKESTVHIVIGYDTPIPSVALTPTAAVGKISYTSGDESIATVDENGRITGVSAGTVSIKATTYNNKSATISAKVFNPPSSVILSAKEVVLGEGQSEMLAYAFEADEFSAISFSSDNEAVAKVDASGKISAIKAGTATISATAVNGVKGTCAVTVKSAPDSIKYVQSSLVIGVGQIFDANDYIVLPEDTQASLTFKPESSYVLENKGDGIIRGKALGTTRVKATTHNGKTALMTVKVVKAPSSFSISRSQDVIYEGSAFELTAVFPANTTGFVTYESDNPEVISVSENGAAKAVSAGTATITATSHNGVKVKMEISVYRHVESVTFSKTEISIVHYDAMQLDAIISPEAVYDSSLTWTSSDSEKVSVTADGRIEALEITASPVTITATSNDTGVSASCLVSVTPVRLIDISLSANELTLERGRSANVSVSFSPENADDKSVTWTSSAPGVAEVDAEGNITAKASSGSARISCVSKDGNITKTVTVTAENVHLLSAEMETSELILTHYDEADMAYVLNPADADITGAVWSVSDPSVVYVSQSGHVKALAVGAATVKLELTDAFGFKYSCSVAVTVEPVRVTSIVLSDSEIHLRIGRSKTLSAEVGPENADNKKINWTVGNKDIVSVQSNEADALVLTGTKAGETTLTAKSDDGGFEAPCTVKVFEALAVEAQPNFTHNTPGNDVIWKILCQNALGDVSYTATVMKDGSQISSVTSYDPDTGIVISSCTKGTYSISVTVRDSEGDMASAESTVVVNDTFTYTENGIVWEYRILNAQGDSGAAVKLVSCPSGSTTITVPATMDGAKVVRIDTEAFMNNTALKRVNIPETVTEIGARAFKGCTALSDLISY